MDENRRSERALTSVAQVLRLSLPARIERGVRLVSRPLWRGERL